MDQLIRAVSTVLTPLFFLGIAGSAIVVVVSFFEDMKELFEKDE